DGVYRWGEPERGGSRILRAQRKRCWRRLDDLAGAVREIAGDAAERALSQVIEHANATANRGVPLWSSTESVCDSQPGCHVVIVCAVERCAAWRQRNRCRIVEAVHGERIVRGVFPVQGRIPVPPDAGGHPQVARDTPRV